MAENGEEKLIAVARHIAKTLGHTDNAMADDILQIFSNFDGRLREKLTENLSDGDDSRNGVAVLDQTLRSLDRQISRYVTVNHPIWSDSADASTFLDAVDELVAAIREWTPMAADKSVTACLDRAEDLLQQCMFRLEEEFKLLMERGGAEPFDNAVRDGGAYLDSDDEEDNDGYDDVEIPMAHPVSDYNIIIDALPSGTINDLHEISKRMVSAGYGKECSLAYSSCRRDFLEESLSRLGFSGLQKSNAALEDDDNEVEIDKWIKAVNMAVRVFYPSERRLCDRVFGYSSATAAVADLSFMEACRVSSKELLNFANGIAMGSRAPDRLFKILDVFEAVKDLLPEIEVLFADQYCLFLRNEAMGVWKRLGESIRGIFMELENLIRRDPAKAAVPGGGLHPITRYVMNYLRAACSRPTLEQVFDENVVPPVGIDRSLSPSSPLAVQMAWIMEVLESNLEAKSKIYRDPALSSVFMMNNGRYIVKKVKDDELGSLLGDDWVRKHTAKVRQYHVNYQRSSWNKILNALKLDNNSLSPNVASKAFKEKLKLFNSQFEEICRTQSTWAIFDEQLKEELKLSVGANLLPAYRNFLGRFHNIQDIGKYAEKHVKFNVEDVEARIDGLFQGTAVSGSGRK
ncbi:exocyst complex component EXO70B1-like [Cynara cardunculus var. scolymus]|uniref:Exocyst subunit Exo70 family protein n=1 Tax=Cynara cardunculus var. scolymus TaxID=59895 RepID=A0A103XNT3_CYNCS|nr:exocyst complex component EXO70B1-like [Cynara cardunculus var. scolymus]XP_024982126.1 exocyst complex component EXO70B1-like [Cynara cardunculus var. scolymus]KVH94095.1 Cullin repeat-like-containing domain-containing protein [Cynara cardunculus var. scolymus]